MSIKDAIKGAVSYIIQNGCPVNQGKACFLITQYHHNNCLVLLSYLLKATDMGFVLLTDKASYDSYTARYAQETRVKVIDKERDKLAAYREMMSSRYVFFMHFNPYGGFVRKNKQTIINLWHGAGYKANNGEQIVFDKVLVPGPAFVEPKAAFFECDPQKILPLGYPRYDLFRGNSIRAQGLREKLAGKKNKLIIWAPTYRDKFSGNGNTEKASECNYDLPLLNSNNDLDKLDELCKASGVSILIKRHPYQDKYEGEETQRTNIVFMDGKNFSEAGIDLYEFLPFTDALISDYSSIAVDYMLLNKPIAFALDDFTEYEAKRGFVFRNPLDYMPGHHLYNKEDLEHFVLEVAESKDRYQPNRQNLLLQMHNPCQNYCARIWETIRDV